MKTRLIVNDDWRSLSYRNRHERVKQFAKVLGVVKFCFGEFTLLTAWAQNATWTYIRYSEDVQDVIWTFYLCSIYVLCPRGKRNLSVTPENLFAQIYQWLRWLKHACIKQQLVMETIDEQSDFFAILMWFEKAQFMSSTCNAGQGFWIKVST